MSNVDSPSPRPGSPEAAAERITHLERALAELQAAVAERTASLEAALAQAEQRRVEAERAHEAKSRFLAHMSHEMRTPLNGVLGLTELALRAARNPAQRRHLEVALQSGQALSRVIDDVLEVSRLESGLPALADEPFDLADTLARAMRGVVPMVRNKPITMLFDWLGAVTHVRGDPARVTQMLSHLLSNAAKFTDTGHVALIGQTTPADAGRCQATIRIDDTGPGMAPDQIDHLFDAFVQGDASLSRRHGGVGLGLGIARALVHQMGGTLIVHSAPGEGTSFTVMLPFATAVMPPAPPVPASGLAWLVTPHADSAQWLARRIERRGWTVRTLGSLDLAARTPTQERPQVILVPEAALVPGADFAALRSAMPHARVWMLVRPDWQNLPLEEAALQLEIRQLVAPLAPRDLDTMLSDAPQPGGDATPAPLQLAGSDHVLLVEDNAVNRLVAEEYLRSLGLPVRTADDGAKAVQACRVHPPRLVLMDLQMPVMDGLEATRRLRALQREGQLPAFPIVALTAHALAADRDQAHSAGMDDYLTKPIVLESLREALSRWVPMSPPS